MKLFWLFVVFMMFLATTSTAFAESETIIKITNTPNHSTSPSIAVSGTDIYLVWTENSKDGSFDMFFSKSIDGGDSFSDPKKIVNQNGNTLSPMIASNEKTIFLTWTYRYPDSYSGGWSDDNSEIFFSKSDDGGNTFSEPRLVSDKETFSSISKMAVDGENIFITWFTHSVPWKSPFKSPNEIFFAESIDGGETFNEPINLSENDGRSDSTNIATDDSNVFIVWSDDYMNNTGIFFTKSSDRGNTFSTTINISKEIPYSDGPYITSDSSNILVTWASHKEGKDPDIFFSKSTDGGNSFTDPKNISNTSGYSIISPIVTDGKNIFVAWGDSKSNSRSILLTNSTDGGETFSKPKLISHIEGVSDSPSIAYDNESLYVTWSRQKELFKDPLEIYFSKISIINSTLESEPMYNPGNEKLPDEYQKDQSPSIQIHPPETINDSIKNLKWLDENGADYSVGGFGVIRLDNNDLNTNKTLIDIPAVHVWSDTDKQGIPVDVIETGIDTGVFYADILLSGSDSSHLQLHISNGDTMTVSFEDEKSGKVLSDSIKVKSKYLPPLKQFQSGVSATDITCKDGLYLLQKYDSTPVCVNPDSISKLVKRGWAKNNSESMSHSFSKVKILKGASSLDNQSLDPQELKVVLGYNNTVTWINEDSIVHTMVGGENENLWSTKVIKPGESSSVTFSNAGIYEYHGDPGPWISGTVIVLPENYDEDYLPSSRSYDFERMHMVNPCTTEQSFCSGVFENSTQIMIQCDFPVHGCPAINFENYTETENIKPEPEERFPGTVKVEGNMAEKICEVMGGDCLPYYIGNPQPDGSLMVGFTISDTVTEKQFIFLIKDGVLSYNVTEHEN